MIFHSNYKDDLYVGDKVSRLISLDRHDRRFGCIVEIRRTYNTKTVITYAIAWDDEPTTIYHGYLRCSLEKE